jgi:hypothetical protein
MAGSNLKDPKNNDLASPFSPYDFGSPSESEAHSDRPLPGIGGTPNDSQAHPQAKRAGYGHQYIGPSNHGLSQPKPNGHENNAVGRASMGGHNLDERGQYTVKVPRGSSL